MDVIHIRSWPISPEQRAAAIYKPTSELTPTPGTRSSRRRCWNVSIKVNDEPPDEIQIFDPCIEPQYVSIFESYLRHSDRPSWSSQSRKEVLGLSANDLSGAEDAIWSYGEELFRQLRLSTSSFSRYHSNGAMSIIKPKRSSGYGTPSVSPGPGVSECQVFIIEEQEGFGLHCLAWELLEAVRVPRMPELRLRVTRVGILPPIREMRSRQSRRRSFAIRRPVVSLATKQADPSATFNVLLVVARDFSRRGEHRDAEPDLAQWPLMSLQKRLRKRLLLEVVRPGSKEELEDHLAIRDSQGVRFNLVHFDLHGRVMPEESAEEVCGDATDSDGAAMRSSKHGIPFLLFAKKNHASTNPGYRMPQTHLAKAEDVAAILAMYQVENVVLNACLSAYNKTTSETNLAHIFLQHGIQNVSAMWFYVHWLTVSTYLQTFYEELLVKNTEFHEAAQLGREAIRKKPTNRTGRVYQDFFICVNYKRDAAADPDESSRDASPTPSADSGASTASANSVRSFVNGMFKPSTPRLSDGFLISDVPVMRMELHLLELEYKLMTFRIVYASDNERDDPSKLDDTLGRMINMWLSTNLVNDVYYYKAKDFGKRKALLTGGPSPREKRSRGSNGSSIPLLSRRPIKALRQTLHVVREVDQVIDPGTQADETENRRNGQRRDLVQQGLRRFSERLQEEGSSYMVLLGSKDVDWWKWHLQHMRGEWWRDLSWSYTVHSRYMRDMSLPSKGRRTPLGM